MLLALAITLRIFSQHRGFNRVVDESFSTSEGYDQKFIDLVNHIEDVLTRRASFAYPGGKDPMTGRRREVASAPIESAPHAGTATTANVNSHASSVGPGPADSNAPAAPTDRVKLTAIIADDYGQHTAIVMNGERSQSVDVGDMVGERKVLKITAKGIVLETDTEIFTYDISGNRTYQHK